MAAITQAPEWGVYVFLAGSFFLIAALLSSVLGATERQDAAIANDDFSAAAGWFAKGCGFYLFWLAVIVGWLWFWLWGG